ncbi:type I restriction enzyme M protein [Allochromatium warmingii]|uniref:site-specific DNA-methyltransferase (adenine-specific) n=1 Tax=Allochromatium warmingii TaxID=61595 RepID=A0A1H3EC58_ALLWA|nr:type I restriction-modification system subunit M [Allochromatium warmingii]SDX76187.1 type I restriction enzyme M protein [Allochromatium warmingii]
MARGKQATNDKTKSLATRQSVDQAVKSICDIMRRGSVTSAVQYVPELTWMLFLRVLDETEQREQLEASALNIRFTPSLPEPYRWRDWGAPDGAKRQALESQPQGDFFKFINDDLIKFLETLEHQSNATIRQILISEIMRNVGKTRIDTEKNLRDVLDKVHLLSSNAVDDTHVFALSQVYEGLLLRMGEKNNDGGQFFTPREVIRIVIEVLNPQIGETVYDPCCGTGGFLAQASVHMRNTLLENNGSPDAFEQLAERTFYGREKESLIYPIALANLVLHSIDHPHLWFGNTLTNQELSDKLFKGAPPTFTVIATNPPFGGKEGIEAQTQFAYKTGSTQVLFLQHVINSLDSNGGRCGIVVDEGLLFRTNEEAFVQTKRKLLDECDLWCIVSLPGGVFTQAGAGVKTNLLFFVRGRPTERIWYYDLSDLKITKRKPLTRLHFDDFLRRLPERSDSDCSWTIDLSERKAALKCEAQPFLDQAHAKRQEAAPFGQRLQQLKAAPRTEQDAAAIAEIEAVFLGLTKEARALENKAQDIENQLYDLKAVNPHRSADVDERTPAQLLEFIAAKGREIDAVLAELRD